MIHQVVTPTATSLNSVHDVWCMNVVPFITQDPSDSSWNFGPTVILVFHFYYSGRHWLEAPVETNTFNNEMRQLMVAKFNEYVEMGLVSGLLEVKTRANMRRPLQAEDDVITVASSSEEDAHESRSNSCQKQNQ